MLEPAGRVVMVSGAARGLGRAIAERLHSDGYTLSLGARDVDALADVSRGWDPGRVSVHRFDGQDARTQVEWVGSTVEQHGRIDGLVNNAGLLAECSVDDFDEVALDAMWEVNVKTPARLTHLAMPHLRRAGTGRVVNVASLSGKRVRAGMAPGYAMTKHALVALSHSTRQAGWADGVRCTAVCPSFMATDMAGGLDAGPEPVLEPADVAELVATALAMPNRASLPELWVNCRLEDAL